MPASLAQRISATVSSTLSMNSWAMPKRRPGAASQKSFSHRLCAFRPAHRRSYSSALRGPGAASAPLGKKGGTVLGKMTSATMPSVSSASRRLPLSQLSGDIADDTPAFHSDSVSISAHTSW